MYSTIARELLEESPLVSGMISVMKLTGAAPDLLGMNSSVVLGISPFKTSSVIPFLRGSKWMPCSIPATLSTVNAMFTGRERGIAFAIWGSTIGGMAAVGPLAGGWLTTTLSWHWAFLINIPVV